MKCSNCGTEIIEGYMYCQSCGEEIRIVPDYEPELFDGLVESIAQIAEDEEEGREAGEEAKESGKKEAKTNKEDDDAEEKAGKKPFISEEEKRRRRLFRIKLGVAGAVSAVLIVFFFFAIMRFNQYYDFDMQYANALTLHDEGSFEESIEVAKHALSINKAEDKTRLLIADDYFELEKYDESNAVLFAMLKGEPTDINVYDRIISNFVALSDYESIINLMDNIDDEEIRERYSMYVADEPAFDTEGGEYEKDFTLSIISENPGVIYYTTDGSLPDKTSEVYRYPIRISEGEVTVSAIFVNEFGVSSDPVSATYVVDYPMALAPVLTAESGTYKIPRLIGVEAPENYTIYYTTNGEDPDNGSLKYSRPLDMPIGSSEFRFVAYDERGRMSDVVIGSYKLEMECYIDKETALNAIKIQLMSKGENSLLNEYKSSYGLGQGENSFYLIDEYAYSGSRTGRRFAVDTRTGSLFEAKWVNDRQDYSLSAI